MKALSLAIATTVLGLSALAPIGARSQPATVGGVLRPPVQQPGGGSLYPGPGSLYPTPVPPQGQVRSSHDGFHRGLKRNFGGTVFIYEEPEVVHDVVVVHDVAAAAAEPAPPPEPPREPYVLGHKYASLPGGCMKLIQGGASYFQCSGKWYRQIGSQYQAVEMP